MTLNFSNHPAHAERTTWTPEQIEEAARLFGEGIVDMGFPAVTPDMSDEEMRRIAHAIALDAAGMAQANGGRCAAMVAGHYAMTIYLVAELQTAGVPCYIGDSIRVAEEVPQPDGTVAIVHRFKFAGFRAYPAIKLA